MSMGDLIKWITHREMAVGTFRFVIDVAVNNAYQIYRQPNLNPGEDRMDALGFHRAIGNAYYGLHRKVAVYNTIHV